MGTCGPPPPLALCTSADGGPWLRATGGLLPVPSQRPLGKGRGATRSTRAPGLSPGWVTRLFCYLQSRGATLGSRPCGHWSQEAETSASGDLSPGCGVRREGSDKHFKVPQLTGSLGAKSELFPFLLICDNSVLRDPGASLLQCQGLAGLLGQLSSFAGPENPRYQAGTLHARHATACGQHQLGPPS